VNEWIVRVTFGNKQIYSNNLNIKNSIYRLIYIMWHLAISIFNSDTREKEVHHSLFVVRRCFVSAEIKLDTKWKHDQYGSE